MTRKFTDAELREITREHTTQDGDRRVGDLARYALALRRALKPLAALDPHLCAVTTNVVQNYAVRCADVIRARTLLSGSKAKKGK